MKAKIAHAWCHRHLVLGWCWILLVVPSVIWWKSSIIFVILLSLYANCEASFAAHHAKMTELREQGKADDESDPCDQEASS